VSKTIAAVQSNYIPWKGYFDLIRRVDEFVFYDHVQYTRKDWRNRNLIKTPNGLQWLTIPVFFSQDQSQSIRDTKIAATNWSRKHWSAIKSNYAKAPHATEYFERLERLFRDSQEEFLCEVNYRFIAAICEMLGIHTPFRYSADLDLQGERVDAIIDMCKKLGADTYICGPAAKNYMSEADFTPHGIRLEWMDYSHYPEHPQLFPPFEHGVTVIDLLLNTGADAGSYIWGG
jgi:hypothetical protein